MKRFDVQGITFNVPRKKAFDFIADPKQLPRWTHAFTSVNGKRALMRTPNGEVAIDLEVRASAEHGTVDWHMTFPDGTLAEQSKVLATELATLKRTLD